MSREAVLCLLFSLFLRAFELTWTLHCVCGTAISLECAVLCCIVLYCVGGGFWCLPKAVFAAGFSCGLWFAVSPFSWRRFLCVSFVSLSSFVQFCPDMSGCVFVCVCALLCRGVKFVRCRHTHTVLDCPLLPYLRKFPAA